MAFPKIDGYVVTEKLGSGSYSTVYKAYTKVGARSTVAIKCVDKSRVKHSGSAVDNLITEIRLLKTLRHPHIVHMHNFTWDDKNIYIIMEFCCGGDLSKYIHRYGRVPEKQVLYFLQQLASALRFFTEKGVVHMDLKPHNLLLHKGSDGKYILKVADFGRLGQAWRVYCPFPPIVGGPSPAVGHLWAIPRNSSISAPCLDLLIRLLQHDPDTRISYEEFFAHQYLDLDHMPSKENYEKAVFLIKQAIELDSCGKLELAFEAYRDSLLYLVPCVSCETDALRKSALTAKLTRYMERAEEIKQYLKEGTTGPLPVPDKTGTRLPRPKSDIKSSHACVIANMQRTNVGPIRHPDHKRDRERNPAARANASSRGRRPSAGTWRGRYAHYFSPCVRFKLSPPTDACRSPSNDPVCA
ncbi:hypothetical protein K1T71_000558 [Dendrolimus kikuchii]|uniref:Uncharacterized protein n=1 Tax=Dendrolimus kikuchii TaxID=765133 RepID=A0ACC1DK13_9NEOP|nr:hypothetical protein K1T71_000558 [Dendrolimus kikuchii]